MGEGYEAGRARELRRRGKEKGRKGKKEGSYKFVPPPHLRKRSDAPVLPQYYDSRMIKFHKLKYVRIIPKI